MAYMLVAIELEDTKSNDKFLEVHLCEGDKIEEVKSNLKEEFGLAKRNFEITHFLKLPEIEEGDEEIKLLYDIVKSSRGVPNSLASRFAFLMAKSLLMGWQICKDNNDVEDDEKTPTEYQFKFVKEKADKVEVPKSGLPKNKKRLN